MKKKRKVYFSATAARKLDEILNYLETHWPKNVKKEFVELLDDCMDVIAQYPEAYPESKIKPGIHQCVLTKHNTLYYRIRKRDIEIITIFDNRKHPKKRRRDLG